MAKAHKAARNIVVKDVAYRWRATGNDGWIALTVWPTALPGPAIHCTFDYDHTFVPKRAGVTSTTRQIVITARIVRRVIEYAIRTHRYDASAKGPELDLKKVDEVIDRSDALRSS
jgi:hypothetical protein